APNYVGADESSEIWRCTEQLPASGTYAMYDSRKYHANAADSKWMFEDSHVVDPLANSGVAIWPYNIPRRCEAPDNTAYLGCSRAKSGAGYWSFNGRTSGGPVNVYRPAGLWLAHPVGANVLFVDGHTMAERAQQLNELSNESKYHVTGGQAPGIYWFVLKNGLGYDYRTGTYTY
ncbi:MAG: hypothetical protein D6820_11995, partial [Lentisphaerae bacterium]